MAETSPYRPVSELDLSGAAHVVAERWRRWKRSFDLYVAGQNIDDSTRKHSLLLHFASMNTQDLFETLAEPADPEDRYEKTVAMLDGQFKVAKNTPFERHVFRQMVPQLNEPVDKFVARLRQQARICDFSDLNDHFSFHFSFISLHIFYEDCRKVTYILVKAALLRGYLYQVSGKEDKGDGGNK